MSKRTEASRDRRLAKRVGYDFRFSFGEMKIF
jgi:hypothetical protein